MSVQLRLWCFITVEGRSTVFFVDAPVDRNIAELKHLIKEKNKFALDRFDADQFTLHKASFVPSTASTVQLTLRWQFNVPVPIMPEEDLPQRIAFAKEFRANITQMGTPTTILRNFPETPTNDHRPHPYHRRVT
jgi:hypothetical protein